MNICDMYDAHEFLDYLDALQQMAESERKASDAKAKARRARSG